MKVSCRKKIALNSKKEAILIPVYKNMNSIKHLTGKRIDDEINRIINSDYFNYKAKEIKSFYMEINKKLKKIYLINVPKELEEYRYYMELGSKFAKICRQDNIHSFSVLSFEDLAGEKKDFDHIRSFIEGMHFGLYDFSKYKSKKENFEIEEIEVITSSTKLKKYMDNYAEEIKTLFSCVYSAKDLINSPASDITPETFCRYVAEKIPENVKVTKYDENLLKENNMNLIYTVGSGSINKPRLLILEYNGNPESDNSVALVGKGVTFDTGGTNLKPTGSIETMKTDMSGAASIFAVITALAKTKTKTNAIAYLPLVENCISHSSYKPGDIITSYSGKTVEVLNTDAEGRLIMADALSLAIEKDPEIVIDVATLTGACVVALGSHCAGLISNRKFLAKNITDISYDVSEDIWELPLYEGYTERIKSKVADLQNIGSKKREAGTTMAGLFLREFVDNYPWIHLDIAGTAFLEDEHPIFGTAATGFGIRLLYYFIKKYYTSK